MVTTTGTLYIRIASGTCADSGGENIGTVAECEVAASQLGLPDTSVSGYGTSSRPVGCIYASNDWLSFSDYASTQDCGSNDGLYRYDCICKLGAGMCICIYVYMCICVYVYVYIYIYI